MTGAEALLVQRRLALIIDGFDEIPPERAADVLTRLHSEHPPGEYLLLSSRPTEYETARDSLTGATSYLAILISRQYLATVRQYLAPTQSSRRRWKQVFDAFSNHVWLKEVFSTPLMVTMADAFYNGTVVVKMRDTSPDGENNPGPEPNPDEQPSPADLLHFKSRAAAEAHLLDRYLDLRYPAEVRGNWSRENARRWLGYLAATAKDRPSADIAWWELKLPEPTSSLQGLLSKYLLVPLLVLGWTGLSAALLHGWVYASLDVAIADGVRIALSATICYGAILYLTNNFQAAVIAVLGAYISGVLSGSYDISLGAGLSAGFCTWGAHIAPRRASYWNSIVIAAAAVAGLAVVAALRVALSLSPDLTVGFGSGFSDGWASRWDEDLNGWIASGVTAALIAASGIRVLAGPVAPISAWWRARRPLTQGLAIGLVVAAFDSWADGTREGVNHGWMLGPLDGAVVGTAVGLLSYWSRVRDEPPRPAGKWHFWGASMGSAVLVAAASVMANLGRPDIHGGWTRGIAEGLCVGILVAVGGWATRDSNSRAARRESLFDILQILAPAAIVALLVTMLDASSAGWAHGSATGFGIGMVVLYWSYRRRAGNGWGNPLSCGATPLAVAMLTLTIAGVLCGFAYGAVYALISALAAKVAQEISQRRLPSFGVGASVPGLAGGLALGGLIAFSVSFSGVDAGWILAIFIVASLAAGLSFGASGRPAPDAAVLSPEKLLRQDRSAFIGTAAAVSCGLALCVGVRTLAGGHPMPVALAGTGSTLVTYGLSAGLVVSIAQTRYGAYTVARLWLAAQGNLPWRLMSFLEDAYENRQILRRNGTVYQFRHELLKDRLAASPEGADR